MIQKKICMMGAFGVGKTSLVSRFVHSAFSDRYLTTIGVKVDRKSVRVNDRDGALILWDLQGEDELQKLRASYLRGTAGFILVVDGLRNATAVTAIELYEKAQDYLGPVPFAVALNKADLRPSWEVGMEQLAHLEAVGADIVTTSAKTGEGVEDLFLRLAAKLI